MAVPARLFPALVAALACGAPAAAQEAPVANYRLVLPVPSAAIDAQALPLGEAAPSRQSSREPEDLRIDCRRGLPCRVRLRGILGGNNGGVAVEGTAFTW